ncbi:type II toxin-antitoxin system VapC family toxin [Mucilaginibacter flavidus]|uniref:type II toxin-antitoxin system VapC family toxin n=1 Tax=Mucilaginibacter flavidus TaxID=2949309 RepID=UPI0020928B83|nr:type II toxin-antitoxin system VapC family toxin [Mucilaginibacter flavidus]MCO5949238.1 type II toxin-antitoxin system VapC family toxin [Mucilaginibacter flavidus]
MGQYLIDNNVISNYFSELLSEKGMDLVSEIIDKTPNISVITEIEALSWISSDLNKEIVVKDFIQNANILPLTSSIVKQTIVIRRSKKTKTPDAIIAATAIVNDLSLITSDKGFDNIKGLKIIDPKTL